MGTESKKGSVTSVADPVGALIAAKRAETQLNMPSAEGLAALRRLCEHNDSVTSPSERIGRDKAIAMLREHFGWAGGHETLNKVCRQLGRKSYRSAS